jgi:hypothetical protein
VAGLSRQSGSKLPFQSSPCVRTSLRLIRVKIAEFQVLNTRKSRMFVNSDHFTINCLGVAQVNWKFFEVEKSVSLLLY